MKRTYSRSHANRGVGLENMIEITNKQYANKGIASVIKQHPEITVTSMNKNRITGGFFKKKGVPDYIGFTAYGEAVIFDVKQTNEATRFPLANIPQHQYDVLESWHEKGAKAFILVSFTKKQYETYLLPFDLLRKAWKGYKGDGRKSIPYGDFVEQCDLVKSENGYVMHYLKAI